MIDLLVEGQDDEKESQRHSTFLACDVQNSYNQLQTPPIAPLVW